MAKNLDNKTVRRGYLTLHRNPGGRFPLSTLSSKRMWMVLYREGPSGRPRIEMYRSEDSAAIHQPLRMIDLESVRSVKPVERKKSFMIQLGEDETMMLQCTSKADMEDWVRDMNRLRGSRVDLASGQNLTDFPAGHEIYEVVPDDEVFRVKLRKSSTLNFSGQCRLEILRDFDRNLFHIALHTENDPPRLIVKWQIDHIRQYGSNNMAFKFQSGSKSSTGVDWFIVDTEIGAAIRIHKSVDYWAKHIVDQIKNIRGLPRGRAPSLPVPQVPDRPSRSNTVDSVISCADSSYAQLDVGARDKPTVYEELGPATGGGKRKKKATKQLSASAAEGCGVKSDSGGVYQALVQPKRDAPSAYATINTPVKPGKSAISPPTSPNGGEDTVYMGLCPDTRQPEEGGTYALPERQ